MRCAGGSRTRAKVAGEGVDTRPAGGGEGGAEDRTGEGQDRRRGAAATRGNENRRGEMDARAGERPRTVGARRGAPEGDKAAGPAHARGQDGGPGGARHKDGGGAAGDAAGPAPPARRRRAARARRGSSKAEARGRSGHEGGPDEGPEPSQEDERTQGRKRSSEDIDRAAARSVRGRKHGGRGGPGQTARTEIQMGEAVGDTATQERPGSCGGAGTNGARAPAPGARERNSAVAGRGHGREV
jgi:hypothetical protein